ncbi:zinc finger protein 467-like isoform X2 [Melanotaenia boesemani]|uniref:zinc finger protein 467-like isoform X2 n=1 Tax=Melanotaenia boesemani TaxID=1250792 RepID=UPI001C048B51|nr:zinc finger protein 467-like isoform X2 [Melanotaenia boesemani]
MSCCVSGCKNRYSPSSRTKFYTIPSGSRQFQVQRRRLWIQAIQRANGSNMELRGSTRICGDHFISGEATTDHDRPDYVPSVFTCAKQKQRKKNMKRSYGGRKSLPRRAKAHTEEETTPPDSDMMETAGKLSVQTPSPPSLRKKIRGLTEEAESKTNTIQSQTTSSPNKTLPSQTSIVSMQKMDKKNPFVLLKNVISPAGGYQCELCSQVFVSVSQFIKHKQEHEDQKAFVSGQADVDESHVVPEDEPSFPCNMCDRSFTTSQNLKRHKLLHVKDGRKCFKCGVLFCRRHNHVLFQPQIESKTESGEESSTSEEQSVDTSVSPEKSLPENQEPQQMAETVDNTQSSQDLSPTPLPSPSPPALLPDVPPLSSFTRTPGLESVKPSPMPCPPSPILRFSNNPKHSFNLNSEVPQYPSFFIQPHLPQHPELPSSLRIFSPQYLTSALLEVQRNYKYILSKQRTVKIENVVKVEPNEPVIISPKAQTVKEVKKEKIAYDLEIEI